MSGARHKTAPHPQAHALIKRALRRRNENYSHSPVLSEKTGYHETEVCMIVSRKLYASVLTCRLGKVKTWQRMISPVSA